MAKKHKASEKVFAFGETRINPYDKEKDAEQKYLLLTSDTTTALDRDGKRHTMHRIMALRSFVNKATGKRINAGDFGGYVEAEMMLFHSGTCWVADNAKVYGEDPVVLDDAYVGENGTVCDFAYCGGCAKVLGQAKIKDWSIVWAEATLKDNALVDGQSKIEGEVVIEGHASVSGDLNMDDYTIIGGDCKIGGTSMISEGEYRSQEEVDEYLSLG